MYRSLDGGLAWANVFAGVTTSAITSAIKRGPAVLIVRSLTGLATLRPFDTGLASGTVSAIAVDLTGCAVYLATTAANLRRAGS